MARVIAVTNQKGGVGKTTTCVNLAASLAATKRRVLLVDMDPQGNATMGSGVDKNALELSGYDMLTKRATAAEVIFRAEVSGFDILPANGELRLHPDRLPAVPQPADRQCAVSGGYGADSHAVRILCPGRSGGLDEHG